MISADSIGFSKLFQDCPTAVFRENQCHTHAMTLCRRLEIVHITIIHIMFDVIRSKSDWIYMVILCMSCVPLSPIRIYLYTHI